MSSEARRLKDFCKQAWNIVTILQTINLQDNVEEYYRYQQELSRLYEILRTIPEKEDNISFADLSNHFDFIAGSEHVKDMQYDNLLNDLNEYILVDPYHYDFYFRVGSLYGFMTGYQIGRGSIYQFKDLPIGIRQNFFHPLMHGTTVSKHPNTERIEKNQENERFLHFRVESVGSYKAREKAILELKRTISILKLIYLWQTSYLVESTFSSYEYHVIDSKHRIVETNPVPVIGRNPIVRSPSLDRMIGYLTNITKKDNRTELEDRIVNAIDTFGMIEDNTPLRIRFLLCIISLEGLLLGKGDKDYLGWKLAEKIAFLLGDSPKWLTFAYNVSNEDKSIASEKLIAEKLAESRRKLAAHIRESYEKRSAFAHANGKGRTRKKEKEITVTDFNNSSMILRLAIEKLTELARSGFTHLSKENNQDTHYIDKYVDDLKYN